eukprot:6177140-Pleurochrysis_carterae.AAC.2
MAPLVFISHPLPMICKHVHNDAYIAANDSAEHLTRYEPLRHLTADCRDSISSTLHAGAISTNHP